MYPKFDSENREGAPPNAIENKFEDYCHKKHANICEGAPTGLYVNFDSWVIPTKNPYHC